METENDISRITCFLLTDTGRRITAGNATLPVYRADDGREFHLGQSDVTADNGDALCAAPVGAMWDADWFRELSEQNGLKYDRNPDGIVLCVRCPGGDWVVDGPSAGGGSWNRTGTVPDVTVTPSILQHGKYHGWLRNGVLEEC